MGILTPMSPQAPQATNTDNNSFAVRVSAAPEYVANSRHQFGHWLNDIAIASSRVHDILVAVGEAVTSAMEHGSRFNPIQPVLVLASVRDGTPTVMVCHHGRWVNPPSAAPTAYHHRGLGLLIIKGLINDVDIDDSPHGTQITMQFDVSEQIAPRLTVTG
jgi:anti-sigma regulatory factor (Ser/Thr protein kinase)